MICSTSRCSTFRSVNFRTLRRGIPVSLGIYPGADGMLIATISTALRVGMTLIALGITMVVIHYES